MLKEACWYALRPVPLGWEISPLRFAAFEMTVGRVSSVAMWPVLLKIDFSTLLRSK